MTPFLELSVAQTEFLKTILATNFYVGKASLNTNKVIKVYVFNKERITMSLKEACLYLSEEELKPLWNLDGSYIFSPYFKMMFKSLKDFCFIKRTRLLFPHTFYTEIPKEIPVNEKGFTYTLLELNNRQLARRCASCGDISDSSLSLKCKCTITKGSLYNAQHIQM